MTAILTHRHGDMSDYVNDADLEALLAELDGPEDMEHPDVSIADESGWVLSAFPSGRVVWEDAEGDGPVRHQVGVDRDEVRRLFGLAARGKLKEVAGFGWEPGYGS